MTEPIRVTSLCIYPLKSARGIELQRLEVDAFGSRFDRRWMVVDREGHFLTQRQCPALARVAIRLQDGWIGLSASGMSEVFVPPGSEAAGERDRVEVWGSDVEAVDVGAEGAAWISELLGLNARIVHLPEPEARTVEARRNGEPVRVAFADRYPFLLVSEESMDDLNARLDRPLPIDRFRANLVVRGGGPFAEDRWERLKIGGIGFRVARLCARCVVTTVDQRTGQTGREPLRTLSRYRIIDGKPRFGVNLVHSGTGVVECGAVVELGQGTF